jgi:hypothetical protein
MRWISRLGGFGLLTILVLSAAGCPQNEVKKSQQTDTEAKAKHDGWWCDEHGIPEGECSMCSAKVAKAFKAKGDWCEQHNRAKSQCFKCDPSLKEVYAAKYRAHYPGKEPPPIEDD